MSPGPLQPLQPARPGLLICLFPASHDMEERSHSLCPAGHPQRQVLWVMPNTQSKLLRHNKVGQAFAYSANPDCTP